MKASELRIGNLVYARTIRYHKDAICSISGLNHKGIYVKYGNGHIIPNDIKPIFLTEEWLIKIGFEKWDIKGEWVFEKVIFKDFDIEQKMIICSSGTCSLEEQENHLDVDVQQFIIRQDIKYVHQLQNLYFALTGKELIYEQN